MNIPAKYRDYMSIREFAKATGLTQGTINSQIHREMYKNTKKQPSKMAPNGFRTLIHKSEIPFGKSRVGKKTGPRIGPRMAHKMSLPPDLTKYEIEDFALTKIANFVIEKGKVPFKNMIAAVAMAYDRVNWSEIEAATDMKRSHLVKFIEELKEAQQEEPAKYPGVMAYLNAGRPYHPAHRDMTKKKRG